MSGELYCNSKSKLYYSPHSFFLLGSTRGLRDREGGGKMKWKLSEVNARAMSRGHNKLIGEFKMAACDVISVRG